MAKKQRRQQQHRDQQPARRRAMGGTSTERFEPGFPMNLLQRSRIFFIMGAFIMVGGVVFAVLLQSQDPTVSVPGIDDQDDVAEQTPTPSPTPDSRTFSAPDQVTQPAFREYRAVVTTNKGAFTIELFGDEAPQSVNNFVFLAQQGFYDELEFHYVVDGFVAQTGDPTNDAADHRSGPGYTLPHEPNELRNTQGRVSMHKMGGGAEIGSQWFINLGDNPSLDFDSAGAPFYYPFGEVTDGLDVALSMELGDTIESIVIEFSEREGVTEPMQFDGPEQVIDAEANTYTATISTEHGDIVIELFADESPRTVNSFVFLAQQGFFDNTTFHRVVYDGIRVAQAGDPTGVQGDGFDGPGYLVEEEPNERRNVAATIAMAKVSGATNFGSQWFINIEDNPGLDFDSGAASAFYPFGRVIEGLDVADAAEQDDAIISITITVTPRG